MTRVMWNCHQQRRRCNAALEKWNHPLNRLLGPDPGVFQDRITFMIDLYYH